jgi:MFS family permease
VSDAARADFWKFWAGQTISQLGSSFTAFALPLLVYKLTGSSVSLAAATAAYFLPYLLFGLLIGAWVDRVDRRRMMIAVDLGRALVIALIPFLAYADALSSSWRPSSSWTRRRSSGQRRRWRSCERASTRTSGPNGSTSSTTPARG